MWNKQKIFSSLTPFTLLDFKGYTSAILWFGGCNMRCEYCYNPDIVLNKSTYCFNDFNDFFYKRKGLLKGVVLCGGEPTIHKELYEVIKKLKSLGFKIKLDTNGLNPKVIKKLLEENLVDYIALDFKANYEKFEDITKTTNKKYHDFLETLNLLINNSYIEFEVRTTYHSKLLSVEDIKSMINILKTYNYTNIYYIQNFLNTESNLGNITSNSELKLNMLLDNNYPFNIKFRNF